MYACNCACKNISLAGMFCIQCSECLFPVAHRIYGVAHTINTANYVYFLGLQKALTLDHPLVTKVFTGNDTACRLQLALLYSIPRALTLDYPLVTKVFTGNVI